MNADLKAEVIYFTDAFDLNIDLFLMSDAQIVISERLKEELIQNKCYAGVKFLPAFGSDLQWVRIHPRFSKK